jgi:type VI secretion system protein ImpM
MSGPTVSVSAPPATALPGWYGKIPALGDFASRRLAPGFIAFWDAWLQRQVLASRALPGEGRQAACGLGPPWRFLLLPGVCGAGCWAGLLAPSRDKVGRAFPLTIALGLAPQPDTIAGVLAADDWFDALDAIALAAREGASSPEQLDAALLDTPGPGVGVQAADDAARALGQWWRQAAPSRAALSLSLAPGAGVGLLLAHAAAQALAPEAAGRTLWWRKGDPGTAAPLLACRGMPGDEHAGLLLAQAP